MSHTYAKDATPCKYPGNLNNVLHCIWTPYITWYLFRTVHELQYVYIKNPLRPKRPLYQCLLASNLSTCSRESSSDLGQSRTDDDLHRRRKVRLTIKAVFNDYHLLILTNIGNLARDVRLGLLQISERTTLQSTVYIDSHLCWIFFHTCGTFVQCTSSRRTENVIKINSP